MYDKKMQEVEKKIYNMLLTRDKKYQAGFKQGYDIGLELGFSKGQRYTIEEIEKTIKKAGAKNEQDD